MENTSALVSKFLAFFFGLVCIGVAFLAQFLGGVLQASLTIFNVVGGPLFGLFSLGMFVPAANQRVCSNSCIHLFTFKLIIVFVQGSTNWSNHQPHNFDNYWPWWPETSDASLKAFA